MADNCSDLAEQYNNLMGRPELGETTTVDVIGHNSLVFFERGPGASSYFVGYDKDRYFIDGLEADLSRNMISHGGQHIAKFLPNPFSCAMKNEVLKIALEKMDAFKLNGKKIIVSLDIDKSVKLDQLAEDIQSLLGSLKSNIKFVTTKDWNFSKWDELGLEVEYNRIKSYLIEGKTFRKPGGLEKLVKDLGSQYVIEEFEKMENVTPSFYDVSFPIRRQFNMEQIAEAVNISFMSGKDVLFKFNALEKCDVRSLIAHRKLLELVFIQYCKNHTPPASICNTIFPSLLGSFNHSIAVSTQLNKEGSLLPPPSIFELFIPPVMNATVANQVAYLSVLFSSYDINVVVVLQSVLMQLLVKMVSCFSWRQPEEESLCKKRLHSLFKLFLTMLSVVMCIANILYSYSVFDYSLFGMGFACAAGAGNLSLLLAPQKMMRIIENRLPDKIVHSKIANCLFSSRKELAAAIWIALFESINLIPLFFERDQSIGELAVLSDVVSMLLGPLIIRGFLYLPKEGVKLVKEVGWSMWSQKEKPQGDAYQAYNDEKNPKIKKLTV